MKTIIETIAAIVMCGIFFVIGKNSGEAEAYKKGYKDALYKRPVSNDLEMVCAGLWIGQENAKYQKRDK